MKIDASQIKEKCIAGYSNSSPIVYVYSHGGLHAFFKKEDDGAIVAIGAAPHKGIAKFLALKKDPDIKWEKDFIEEKNLSKSEEDIFLQLRSVIFSKTLEIKKSESTTYYLYEISKKTIEILDKAEIENRVKNSAVDLYSLVRNTDLSQEPQLLIDTSFVNGRV
jgi:hypothetical protein